MEGAMTSNRADMAPGAEAAYGERQSLNNKLPTMPEVIEHIGMGPAQIRAGLLGGGVWFVGGLSILLINATARSNSFGWEEGSHVGSHRHGLAQAAVTSVLFVGVLTGNAASGIVGNKLGRRQLVVGCFSGCCLVAFISSFTEGFWPLVCSSFLLGTCYGIGQPAWIALNAEITPVRWRLSMTALSTGSISLGELAAALLLYWDSPTLLHLRWPLLMRLAAIPMGVLAVLSALFLPKSPSYLALHGKYGTARDALASLRDTNHDSGSMPVEFRFQPAPPVLKAGESSWFADAHRQFGIVFGQHYAVSTFIVLYSCFVLNFVFFGSLYVFPRVFPELPTGRSPAAELFLGALAEFPGWLLGGVCGMYMARKPMIKFYTIFTALSLVAFGVASTSQVGSVHGHLMLMFLHSGYYGIKFFTAFGFIALYQYASELYPTEARMAGTAVIIAGGRLGGIVSPLVFDALCPQQFSGTRFDFFFFLAAALCAVNLVLTYLLPFETAGKLLQDDFGSVSGDGIRSL